MWNFRRTRQKLLLQNAELPPRTWQNFCYSYYVVSYYIASTAVARTSYHLFCFLLPSQSKQHTMPTGPRWDTRENCHMLHGMLQNPPIAPDEWKRCCDVHREEYPDRDDGAQRRQYNKLVKKSKNHPTGDPNMPEDLDLARQVNKAIADRCNLSEMKTVRDGSILFFVLGVFDLLITFDLMLAPIPQVERQQHLARRYAANAAAYSSP